MTFKYHVLTRVEKISDIYLFIENIGYSCFLLDIYDIFDIYFS